MQTLRWLVRAAALAGLACLAVTLSAQKGKPVPVSYSWEMAVPEGPAQFIELPGGVLADGGDAGVLASYTPATAKSAGYSQFMLRVSRGSAAGPWTGFKNILSSGSSGTWNCNFPAFDSSGALLPGTRVAPSAACLVDFLSGHRHPQGPYWMTQVGLRVPDLDIFAIPAGHEETRTVARLDVFVRAEDGTAPGAYSSIGYQPPYLVGSQEMRVIVARSADGNSWTTTINWPIQLAEVYYAQDRKGRTQTIIPMLTTTTPVQGEMVWTRRVAQ